MRIRKNRGALALTVRLVAGYTMAAALILTGAALYLYRGLEKGFAEEDTELLSDQIEQVRGLIKSGSEQEARQFIISAAGVRELEKYYGRLLDEHGSVLVQTPDMDRIAPQPSMFPKPLKVGVELHRLTFWHGPKERLSLLASGQVERPGGVAPWVFQIALDAAHVAEWLEEYRERLYWMIGGGTVFTALLGWFITQRGLRPLRDIAEQIKDVTAHEMHGRLDAKQWPAELAVLAEEFDEMLGRLRDSFSRLSQFSADVAHEFRTPLNNLMGATTLALSRSRSAEDYRAALEGNLEQFERLGRMVESLLFIARADNAEALLNKHQRDAGIVAREVCDFFSALAEEREITLTCTGSANVWADDVLLRLALTNLISNALRHTPRGGKVGIAINTITGGYEIAVSDTGAGIPTDHHSRLFDRFYRVDLQRSGSETGVGLGLAIVKSVMSLHSGTVTVESAPGSGTTFRMIFPEAPVG